MAKNILILVFVFVGSFVLGAAFREFTNRPKPIKVPVLDLSVGSCYREIGSKYVYKVTLVLAHGDFECVDTLGFNMYSVRHLEDYLYNTDYVNVDCVTQEVLK